jgi:hypothetical protein
MSRRWTPKIAIARSRRNLAAAVERLRLVSVEWSDVDGSIEYEAEDLIRTLEEFSKRIDHDINERLAAGEHVGL